MKGRWHGTSLAFIIQDFLFPGAYDNMLKESHPNGEFLRSGKQVERVELLIHRFLPNRGKTMGTTGYPVKKQILYCLPDYIFGENTHSRSRVKFRFNYAMLGQEEYKVRSLSIVKKIMITCNVLYRINQL